jgi:hypothetical protein
MYGFQSRLKVTQNYTGPVSLGDREWVYAQCHLPFYPEPTTRLHFCAQPLPAASSNVTDRPNVVFLQFDAMGRQAMYRRMPRSYKLLSTYEYVHLKHREAIRIEREREREVSSVPFNDPLTHYFFSHFRNSEH